MRAGFPDWTRLLIAAHSVPCARFCRKRIFTSSTIRALHGSPQLMRTDEFDFVLPERLIAQHPPERRGASRL
jgi:hypothetical protein